MVAANSHRAYPLFAEGIGNRALSVRVISSAITLRSFSKMTVATPRIHEHGLAPWLERRHVTLAAAVPPMSYDVSIVKQYHHAEIASCHSHARRPGGNGGTEH